MLRWVVFVAIASCGPAANAGPWVRSSDETYSRLSYSRATIESLDASRLDAYSEHGLTDDWTLTLKYERLQFDNYQEYNREGWRGTVRRGFHLPVGLVASLETGLMQGTATGGAAGCESFGAEARAGLGQSFNFPGRKQASPAFWFAEAAYRSHDDGCARQRLEFGYGQRVFGDVWAISQAWFEDGSHNSRSSKYQFEYLWKADVVELSLGAQSEFGGQFEDNSVFVAISKVF